MLKKMLKQRFHQQYERYTTRKRQYKLSKINNQKPVVYSADEIMQVQQGKRCDSFVLCCCSSSTTGIYVVEEKGKYPDIEKVRKQLQSGADFIGAFLCKNDEFVFSPVLVSEGIRGSSVPKLKAKHIRLCEKERYIKHVKTGDSLEKLPQ